MTFSSIFRPSKQLITSAVIMIISAIMVAYAPMASVSTAQAVNDNALSSMKDKALEELQRRIDSYTKTLKSMDVNVQISKDGTSTTVSSDRGTTSTTANKDGVSSSSESANGSSSSFRMGKNGLEGDIKLPADLKDKVKQFMEKIIEGLTGMVDKVKEAASLEDMQKLAENIDTQFELNQLTQVASAVTQAVSSITGVLENLKTTFNNL